uniref:Capsid protein n=1 Tax=Cerdocyon thous torque teno virus 4 TaxID=2751162 RepID=A0A7D5GIA1_9VIRU|nr:ORF1 [Cerdocyon thous torque teno virus 4]
MTWMPKQRKKCTIRGWTLGITGTQNTLASRSSDTFRTTNKFWFISGLGCTNILTLSLRWFYWEWIHWRNTWSTSNQGFDLARYFGTYMYFWPHYNIDYAVWWDTEYGGQTLDDFRRLQPGICLLQKQHVVVHSIKSGRHKPKKVKLRPPATQDTNWYMQSAWCSVGLARVGITILNLKKPFIHTQMTSHNLYVGIIKSTTSTPWNNYLKPPYQDIPTNTTSGYDKIYYRWDMDTGTDNAIIITKKTTSDPGTMNIVTNTMPYYTWFYGWKYRDIQTLGYKSSEPSATDYHTMFFWWYKFKGEEGFDWLDKNNRTWIMLTLKEPPTTYSGNITDGGISSMMNLVQHGPFATTAKDLQYLYEWDNATINSNLSIPISYKSFWQWGGQTTHSGQDVVNPCGGLAPRIYVTDPSIVHETTIHPWDIDTTGFIRKDKLREIIGGDTRGLPEETQEMDTDTTPYDPTKEEEESDMEGSSDSSWPSSSEEELSTDDGLTQTRRKTETLAKRIAHERQRRKHLRSKLLKLCE